MRRIYFKPQIYITVAVFAAVFGVFAIYLSQAGVSPTQVTFENGSTSPCTGGINTTAGNSAFTPTTEKAYEGTYSAKASYTGGGQNAYARCVISTSWKTGDEVWYGGAFFLPTGFTQAMQNQVDLMRWDNYSLNDASQDWGGLIIQNSDKKARLKRFNVNNDYVDLSTPFTFPENRWVWVEVKQKLSPADSQETLNEVWIDGVLQSSSKMANTYYQSGNTGPGRDITRIRYGLVAIGEGSQTNPLSLWVDRATISTSKVGPVGTSSPTCSAKPGDINNDNAVDIFDLSMLLSAYGQTTTACADVNRDGKVDIFDLSILLSGYGKVGGGGTSTCPLPAYPDANCTGVPTGTTLTSYSGPLVITTPNTVIDGKTINGKVEVQASGVVIKNSVIHGGVYSDDQLMYGKVGVVVEDSEIDCGGTVGSHGVGEANFTLRRVEITQCENGIDANQNILIEDSYIHNLSHNGSDPHEDGIQLGAGFWNGTSAYISNGLRNITVRHNTIFGMGNPNDSVFGTSAWIGGPVGADGILLENNLLAGGAYTVYCSRQGENPTSYRLINNHFTTRFKSTVGSFGVSSDCANDYQSGNVIHETGQPIILGD